MKAPFLIALLCSLMLPTLGLGADAEDLARKFKQLPTVPENELSELSNEKTPFRGVLNHETLQGYTYVAFPFVENAASLDMDPQGRIYVSEANRFWLGVPDLRGANEMIRDDFKAITVEDRLKMYEKFADHFPEGWFSAVADRVIRLEDRDKNGAADHRTLFSDHFHQPADGIGFSLLAEDDAVYFTCIPSLWKMTDTNKDGMADNHEAIVEGFGVRVSFIGHDLHGIVRGPDGRLYFSVGDRGYHVTTEDGTVYPGSGRGAVFRCDSDGSNFELYAMGLRNPQELVFDDHGNLFTFDNTGDIGDKARFVYVLENSDSGWDMSHQSAHHYSKVLDWEEYRPPKSVWVSERMFDLWNEEQPQWVYPPASHVANGPSGVAWLTGESLPEDLRGQFLLTNYRGASERCTVLGIDYQAQGAGYVATVVEELITSVGASDVELGYDGKLYLADFGGGWSVNTNASIQVVESTDENQRKAGLAVAEMVAGGLPEEPEILEKYLSHPDQRVRQMAQFKLVELDAANVLARVTKHIKGDPLARLHAIWGLGQLIREGKSHNEEFAYTLTGLLNDLDAEVRANAARVLGDCRVASARNTLLPLLKDESLRVRSLAAIALGRICEAGDEEVINALYSANTQPTDVVLRHSLLSALDRVGTEAAAASRVESESNEEKLLAVLFLRRHQSEALGEFLKISDPVIYREVLRAIYDTEVLDSPVGQELAKLNPQGLPEPIQLRIVGANYRLAQQENARQLLALAGQEDLPTPVRVAALRALEMWEASIDTDPVLGHYRPQVVNGRTMDALGDLLTNDMQDFLKRTHPNEVTALAIDLARETGIKLDESTLRIQVADMGLDPTIRIAVLENLAALGKSEDDAIILKLLDDKVAQVRAAAMRFAFARNLEGMDERGLQAVKSDGLLPARAAIGGLNQAVLEELWNSRNEGLRPELWMDAYLALLEAKSELVQAWATEMPANPQTLAKIGGDPAKGEQVFRNQGACMQCHIIRGEGGLQGPDLTAVASRLQPGEILESLINPNAVISEGYGMTSVTKKDGAMILGRIAEEDEKSILVVGLDNSKTRIKRDDIQSLTPPVSAMPPLAMTLPLPDLRDLVAFLSTTGDKVGKKKDDASHGDADHGESEAEKIAK